MPDDGLMDVIERLEAKVDDLRERRAIDWADLQYKIREKMISYPFNFNVSMSEEIAEVCVWLLRKENALCR